MVRDEQQPSLIADEAPVRSLAGMLGVLNETGDRLDAFGKALCDFLQDCLGCQAVAIRLQDGPDYPFAHAIGLDPEFLEKDRWLCRRDQAGELVRDQNGDPVLDCRCGRLISGRPCRFGATPAGSVWSARAQRELGQLAESDLPEGYRGYCLERGFESLALVPISLNGRALGLIQVMDRRPDQLSEHLVQGLETLARAVAQVVQRIVTRQEDAGREAYFQTLLAQSSQGLLTLAHEGGIRYASPGLGRMLGRDPGEMAGRPLAELLHPEDVDALAQSLKLALTGVQRLGPLHLRVRHAGGEYRTVLAEGKVLLADPVVQGILVSCTDVTESRQAQRALEQSEKRFKRLFEQAPVAFGSLDRQGRILQVNQTWLDIMGYPRREVIGHLFSEFVSGRSQPLLRENYPRLREGEGALCLELELTRNGGDAITVHLEGRPHFDGQGRFLNTVCAFHDITRQCRAQSALAMSEERHRRIVETALEGVWLVDAGGMTTMANRALGGLLGCDPDKMKGRPLTDFVDPEHLTRARAALASAGGGAPTRLELRLRTIGGGSLPALVSMSGLPGGEHLAMVADLRQHHAHAERRQRDAKLESLHDMAGGLAHDFNNLLMAILGHADLALDTVDQQSEMASDLRQIKESAQKASELAANLLTYTGRVPVSASRVRLSELVESLCPRLSGLLPAGVPLAMELNRSLPVINADPAAVDMALCILVTNAGEALSQDSGMVTVATGRAYCDRAYLDQTYLGRSAREGEYLCLDVRDNGAGMDQDTARRMFDPFFSTKFAGRGLGLASVLGLLRAHGGTVAVHSVPGRGTLVRLLLPVAGADADLPSEENAERPRSGLVLVADDDPLVLEVACRMLAKAGHRVVTASNGEEAVERFAEMHDQLALVLLDLAMPRMNGGRAFSRMKDIDPAVPVIICSGHSADEVGEHLPLGELAGYLQKPFDRRTLSDALARHMREPKGDGRA